MNDLKEGKNMINSAFDIYHSSNTQNVVKPNRLLELREWGVDPSFTLYYYISPTVEIPTLRRVSCFFHKRNSELQNFLIWRIIHHKHMTWVLLAFFFFWLFSQRKLYSNKAEVLLSI